MRADQGYHRHAGLASACFRGAFALCVLLLMSRLWKGIDPSSLWLDDLWTGIVIRRMSWARFFELRPPVPIGFVALGKFFAMLSSDPEWPLQLLPVLCVILQVPIMATIAFRWTRRRSLALTAGVLLSICPVLMIYGVHVKPYSCDSLITCLLLFLGLPLLNAWRSKRAAVLAAAGLLGLLFSFPSIFISTSLLGLSWARALADRKHSRIQHSHAAAILAGFALSVALLYTFLLSGQANSQMQRYWAGFFLPFGSPLGMLSFLDKQGIDVLVGALPNVVSLLPRALLRLLAAGLMGALVGLVRVPRTRFVGLWMLLLGLGALAASGLRLYPVGAGRTDTYLHPVTLLLVVLGADLAISRLRKPIFAPVCAGAACLLASAFPPPTGYWPPVEHAETVERLKRERQAGASIILYPHASFAVAYYSGWPIECRPWPEYAHGFRISFPEGQASALPAYADLNSRSEDLRDALRQQLESAGKRVVYYATDLEPDIDRLLRDTIATNGYRCVEVAEGTGEVLVRYVRREEKVPERSSLGDP